MMPTASGNMSLGRRKRKVKEKEKEKETARVPSSRTRKKRKEEEEETHVDLVGSPKSKWQNLSSDLLQQIIDVLSSIPDVLSFSAVCNSWRSLAKSSPISPPPLLLCPLTDKPNPRRSSMSLLKTLTPDLDPRTYRSPISKSALNRNCCGCSYGHLVFASNHHIPILIADLFSSDEILLPKPPLGHYSFHFGVLTAPPSSSSSTLLLVDSSKVLRWPLRADPCEDDWSVYDLSDVDIYNPISIVVFNEKLYLLDTKGRIFAFDVGDCTHWEQLPNSPYGNSSASVARLAECNGELLLVCFMRTKDYSTNRIEVYKMDFSVEGAPSWVRIESIGDWCLFMDKVGNCPLACRNLGKWGGQSNCVYFARPPFGSWSVLPMDGTEFNHVFEYMSFPKWPSPVWAYPSKLL